MKELIDALVKAQSEMTHGLATGVNPHFKSEYAPLDEVIRAVKKPLNDNGIFFLQKVYLADNGQCVETEFHGHGAVVKGGKVYVIADKKTPMAEAEKEKPKPKKKEPVKQIQDDKDEAWAETFVEGFLKVATDFCDTKESVKEHYKNHSDEVALLKQKFPTQKKRLDDLAKQLVENLEIKDISEEDK